MNHSTIRRLGRRAFTLAEMLVALGVFAMATLGIWETIRTNFFLAAKNTGLNLSHKALQNSVDGMANQLRTSLQILDVDTFDGTKFTALAEGSATTASSAGNAVRFVRLLPITLYLLPDDGTPYTLTNPESPKSLNYPDYLTPGNKTVKGNYVTAASNLTDSGFLADLNNARLFPRFPYIPEQVTGASAGTTLPGMDVAGVPSFSGTNQITITLSSGLPAADRTKPSSSTNLLVPSCNQAYFVIVSAYAVLNRGTSYAELLYYPDTQNLSRYVSLSRGMQVSTVSGAAGPMAFGISKKAGAPSDPSKRASLNINLPVYAPDLANSVVRRGGIGALNNVEVNLPVEVARRALF